MPAVDKIITKMKNQPNGISIDEADIVLRHHNYRLDRQKGSHRQYITSSGDRLTIPERRPTIKPVYVKEILRRIGE